MKKLILLAPFILFACGPSQKEINKARADSIERSLIISKVNHQRVLDSLDNDH